ncbi:MAG: glycoside hydrolase family 6 protein [Microbacterium sp.]
MPSHHRAVPSQVATHVVIWALGAAVIAVAAVLVVGITTSWFRVSTSRAPRPGDQFVVLDETSAATAAGAGSESSGTVASTPTAEDELAAAQYLAAQPTAYWLTPERDPIGAVGARVTDLASEARAQDATLVLVVYGLPERDCGAYSAGGLDTADYPVWIDEISAALAEASDVRAVVVLEPDSLALATECGNLDDRVAQLQSAIATLQREDTWIYLDGGHSNWHPATETAELLAAVGLDGVRGFSVNVSNFNTTDAETTYAHAVVAALEARGVTADVHAVIDTSRNGAGSTGQWCNPSGRRVGAVSGAVGDDVVDTNLWIKPPGESDGTCNGGPAAGVWWPAAAVELTQDVRG